jgi:hypothetical protein
MAVVAGLIVSSPVARADDTLATPGQSDLAERIRVPPPGWRVLTTQHLLIQYPPSEEASARLLTRIGDEEVEQLMDELELSLDRPLVVRLAGDAETFSRVQPGRPPTWAAGTAYPNLELMVLMTHNGLPLNSSGSFRTTFVHETVHLLLGRAFGDRPVPRWLNEGLARYLADEVSLEEWATLSRAILMGGLIPFSELEQRFPAGAARAELAYAQSREFLSYLFGRYPGLLPRLVQQLSQGSSLNEALWHEARAGLTGLEEDWLHELKGSFAWLSALTGGLTLWGGGAVLLVLAFARKRRQSQERRARWAEEEALVYGPEAVENVPMPVAAPSHLRLIQGGLQAHASEQARRDGADDDEEDDPSEVELRQDAWSSRRSAAGEEGGGDDGDEEEGGEESGEESAEEEVDPEDRPPPGGWLH